VHGFDVPSRKGKNEGHKRKLDEVYFLIGGRGTMGHLYYLINPTRSTASLTQVTTKS
jgi:hypothetical protein